MKIPKEVGRIYNPFDWFGWSMSIFGLVLMGYFGGIIGPTFNGWILSAVFFCFWEYAIRVAYGRVFKYVYYDTIIHNMYKLEIDDKIFYVNAFNESELALYMDIHYPGMNYSIIEETHTESFIKEEHYS
jgi:hypothetical protein